MPDLAPARRATIASVHRVRGRSPVGARRTCANTCDRGDTPSDQPSCRSASSPARFAARVASPGPKDDKGAHRGAFVVMSRSHTVTS